ncbi:MAG: hypothetical protein QM760_06685 [Nibricoccus sp.]
MLAKGENRFALRIKALAAEHGVPIGREQARRPYALFARQGGRGDSRAISTRRWPRSSPSFTARIATTSTTA